MSLALVTGASGFIGGHLVEALVRRGDQVRCLARKSSRVERVQAAGVEIIRGEFDQPRLLDDALHGVDVVYHLAGLTAALANSDLIRVNGEGCRRIAQACSRQRRPPRLVAMSSIAAAGPARRGEIRVESDVESPVSNYGSSKLAGEQAVQEVADRVPTTIVRPGIVFGPWNRAMLPVFQTIKYLNLHPIPGYRQPALSYIHVDDLTELVLRVAERGQTIRAKSDGAADSEQHGRGIYFAVAPEYPTYADLGRLAGRLLGRPFTLILPCLGPVPWMIAGASELMQRLRGKADELNYDKIREATVESWACSAEAAKRDLAFAPPKPLAERLAETIAWYRREKWL